MTALPDPRRIVLSNSPLPSALADTDGAEPAVQVAAAPVPPISELDGQAARHTVFTHPSIPTSNAGLWVILEDTWRNLSLAHQDSGT